MKGAIESETVGTPTPVIDSDPTPSPPPLPSVSSSARHPPCPPRRSQPPSLTETDGEQISEVDPSDLPAVSQGKKTDFLGME